MTPSMPCLRIPSVQAVIIATPPGPRYELALRALAAGKHLLLEKPVALNAGQVADLQRTALSIGPQLWRWILNIELYRYSSRQNGF